jgi:hypothetical protein
MKQAINPNFHHHQRARLLRHAPEFDEAQRVLTHSVSTADIREAEINALTHPSLPSRKNFFIINYQLQSIFKARTISTTQIKNSPHSAKVLNLALTHHMPASEQQRPDSSVGNKRKPSRHSSIISLLMHTLTDQSIIAHHNASQQELPLGRPLA